MKLITKQSISFNDGVAGQNTGVVTGNLITCNQRFRAGLKSIFMYEYKTEGGKNILNNTHDVSDEDTNKLYELVKNEVPTGLSYTETTTYLYYLGMRLKMAETFKIQVSDIEIIID
jgi:hypothetical protein